jgi:hypothetical protein
MFLRQIQQSSLRQRRIRHWSLLALRAAALALLVIAFARPLLRGDAIAADRGPTGREVVILLDDSWSMGFEDRFARGVAAAADRIAKLGPSDTATLIVFSDRARVEAAATSDTERLTQILEQLAIEPHGTRYAPALKLARKAVLDSRLPAHEVVLITDFQRVGWERGEDLRLPPGTELSTVDLSSGAKSTPPSNLAVAGLLLDRTLESDRERVVAQARVTRRGGEGEVHASLALELGGRELGRRDVRLGPEASELVSFEPFSLPAGISRGRLVLEGDALATDNQFFFVLSRAQALPVVLIDDGKSASGASGFYVEQALRLGREPLIDVRRRSPSTVGRDDLAQAAVVVVSDVALDAETVRRLQAFVEQGGGLVAALGSKSEGTHAALAGAGLVPAPAGGEGALGADSQPGSRIARIASLDRGYPGLDAFAGPRSGDFGTARFFRHREVQPAQGDRVLARFDDGDPALVERSVGKGRVLVWTSTLDTYWNDFALQPVFLPFVHQVVKSLAGFRPPATSQTVGDVVDLQSLPELSGGEGELRATDPKGEDAPVTGVLDLDQQGFYSVSRGGKEAAVLAANVDVRESDLTALDVEELTAAVAPTGNAAATPQNAAELTPREREAAQGLWRYLVLAVLLLLVAEVFVANRLSAAGGG